MTFPSSEIPSFPMSPSQERALFRRITDGTATDAAFRALESQLRVDEELRKRYILHMGLEAHLYEEMTSPVSRPGPGVSRFPVKPRWMLLIAACCVCVGIVFGSLLQWVAFREIRRAGHPGAIAVKEDVPAVSPYWREVDNANSLTEVAIVSFADDAATKIEPDWFQAGRRLKPGLLTLPQGELQLEFVNGAQVLLRGPATLKIDSVMNATLVSGQAAARVPDFARGFVLNSPGAAVVDLGTEFAVQVSDRGESEIHVTEGEVEVSLLGQDGNTVQSERLKDAGAVIVRQNESRLDSVTDPSSFQLRIPERELPKLAVSEEYVQTIKAARPFAYWRFEQLVQNQVPNEMGPAFTAVLHPAADDPGAVSVAGGVAMLRASPHSRYFSVDGGIPGWNSRSFSIEIWACPDRLQHGALVDILSEDWEGDLNTIEMAMKTAMIHPPGTYRFFHRHPPSQSSRSGINLFDHETCTPMRWTHLVATKTPDGLSLYVNGQEVRRIDGAMGSDDAVYQLAIGQMDQRPVRQFEGALDEVALYDRALSSEEVSQHYQLLREQHRL